MKTALERWSLALGCLLLFVGLSPLAAQQVAPPAPLPKPKPLPPIGQNTIPDPNAKPPAQPGTTPAPVAPTIKPWVPPTYPQGVHTRSLKPGEKLGGDMTESISLKNEPAGNKVQNVLTIPENMVLDLGTGARLFCLPQVGEKETRVTNDGWFTTHGSSAQPCYFGAYSGRITLQTGCAIKAQYCVFKDIDFNARGALMEFSNCLFVNCTIRVDGSAGGQLDMTNCTMQEGGDTTALTLVRSVRGPIVRLKNLKIDGYQNGLFVDAYDAAMARTTLWDVKELSLINIRGKAILDSDPIRADFGRMYLMGEKDTKAAIEKWVEIKTPGSNMKGTPAVNIAGLAPTELPQSGTTVKMPSLEVTNEDQPAKPPKKTVPDLGDDG